MKVLTAPCMHRFMQPFVYIQSFEGKPQGLFTVADLCLHPGIWMLNMDRRMLSDTQWFRIAELLPGKPTDKGGRAADNRRFVEAVLYVARTGSPWRDLPKELGNWHSVYVRFARWEEYGVWHRVAEALQGDADLEELFIDATIVRAHQHAAGAPKKTVAIKRSVARGAG
mgnify:FL=1